MHKINIILVLSACLLISACNTNTTRQTSSIPEANTANNVKQKAITPIEIQRPTKTTQEESQQQNKSPATVVKHIDVWERIRQDLQLNRHLSQRTVQNKLRWYARHQDYIDRVAERATPYLHYIVEELEKRDMPLELALLPIVESAYHPFAYSRSHASGIWQFIPSTGKIYGLKQNWWYDGRRDIVAATDAALRYLEKLHKEFDGDWLHALAAYNSGERNVARAIKRNKAANKATDFFSLRLPRETRGYVPSLLAVAELLANAEQHNVKWQAIDNEPYFAEIDIAHQIDLATAAELANMDMDSFYTLNPGYNRWATDPHGPHRLLVPVTAKDNFLAGLEALPDKDKIKWQRHVIKQGETLGEIAARYRTSVETLRTTNKIRGTLIRAGKSILIPVASKNAKHYTLSLDNRRFRGLKKAGDGEKYTYTIKRGDTLWDIGRHYGFSVKQLLAWNGISSSSLLKPGQKITLWFDEDSKQQTAGRIKTSHHKSSNSYTVRRGDSLWLISRRHGVTVAQLRQWNNLPRKSYLQPGQKLIIGPAVAKKTET